MGRRLTASLPFLRVSDDDLRYLDDGRLRLAKGSPRV